MRILIFSAHPDDAEFSMGGTLLLLTKEHHLTLAVWTDGDAGTYGDAKTRKREQEASAAMLGATLLWLGKPDCSIQHDQEHILRAAQIIRDVQPDAIFAPHWDQQGDITHGVAHPEHRNLGMVVKDAARYARFAIPELHGERHKTWHLFWYMVPQHRTAKICVGVDSVREDLKKLWKLHASQNQLKEGMLCETLLAWRAGHAGPYEDMTLCEIFDADKPVSVTSTQFFGTTTR